MTTATATKSKCRLLRFSLRTLLVCMLIVCVTLGTLGWKVQRAKKQRAAVAWVQKLGGEVIYNYVKGEAKSVQPGPKWLRELLGVDFFDEVVYVVIQNEQLSDVTPLAGLPSLTRLNLKDTQVKDVTPLARLMSLTHLNLLPRTVRVIVSRARALNLATGPPGIVFTVPEISGW